MSATCVRASPAIDRALDLAGDRLHGLEVAGRGDREAGLDDVDAQARELLGDLELLGRVERDARRLLAVAQRRVEDQYSVGVVRPGHVCSFASRPAASSRLGLRLRGRHALFPPKGEEKKSEGRAGATFAAERSTGRLTGPEHDLADVAPLGDHAVRVGARSNGNASATTGRDRAVVEHLAQRRIQARACRRRPTGVSMFRPITALDSRHLLDQVEARHAHDGCGRR